MTHHLAYHPVDVPVHAFSFKRDTRHHLSTANQVEWVSDSKHTHCDGRQRCLNLKWPPRLIFHLSVSIFSLSSQRRERQGNHYGLTVSHWPQFKGMGGGTTLTKTIAKRHRRYLLKAVVLLLLFFCCQAAFLLPDGIWHSYLLLLNSVLFSFSAILFWSQLGTFLNFCFYLDSLSKLQI